MKLPEAMGDRDFQLLARGEHRERMADHLDNRRPRKLGDEPIDEGLIGRRLLDPSLGSTLDEPVGCR